MALLIIDGGAEYYSTMSQRWDGGTATRDTSNQRTGAACIANPSALTKAISSGQFPTFILGYALKFNRATNVDMATFKSDNAATTHLTFRALTTGAIEVYRGTSGGTLLGTTAAGVIPNGTYAFIEIKATLHDTTGAVDIRVNGSSVLSLSSVDTKNAGTKTIFDSFTLTGAGGGGQTLYFDDIYLCNTSGSANNDFIGDSKVYALRPIGAGTTTQLTPNTGQNWAAVDDATPDSLTTYVFSSTDNQYDTYSIEDLSTSSGFVAGIQVSMFANKSETGAKSVTSVYRHGSTDYPDSDLALGTDFAYMRWLREINPATGTAYTPAEINAMESGPKVRP